MMFVTFLDRVSPDSSSAKPACMKKTSAPATRTQTLSRTACTAADGSSVWAAAGVVRTAIAALVTPSATNVRRFTGVPL